MNLVNMCPEDLLGAYAVDALVDEREDVELHLPDCPRCRGEVARHREILAGLVLDRLAPPEYIWDRLVASLEESPPALRLVDFQAPRSARRPRRWVTLAAVAAVATGLLGVRSVMPGRGAERSPTALERSALVALSDPSSTKVMLASAGQSGHGQVVLLDDGRGYAIFAGLQPLPDGRTYQLWALRGGERISAGVLGARPALAAFEFPAEVSGFAVTEETAGGVSTSAKAPVLIGFVTV
jgi:hypothetical protein